MTFVFRQPTPFTYQNQRSVNYSLILHRANVFFIFAAYNMPRQKRKIEVDRGKEEATGVCGNFNSCLSRATLFSQIHCKFVDVSLWSEKTRRSNIDYTLSASVLCFIYDRFIVTG